MQQQQPAGLPEVPPVFSPASLDRLSGDPGDPNSVDVTDLAEPGCPEWGSSSGSLTHGLQPIPPRGPSAEPSHPDADSRAAQASLSGVASLPEPHPPDAQPPQHLTSLAGRLSEFLSSTASPSDSVELRRAKVSCAAILLLLSISGAACSALLCAGASTGGTALLQDHLPRALSYLLASAVSAAMLAGFVYTKSGLPAIRLSVGILCECCAIPWHASLAAGQVPGGTPLVAGIHSHVVTLLGFVLMGGDIRSPTGGRLLTALHVAILWGALLSDYGGNGCGWLAGGVPRAGCLLVYAEPLLLSTALAVAGHVGLGCLLSRLEHERMVAGALVDNCLPVAISSDISGQISYSLQEASRLRSQSVVKQYVKDQPELIGFHVAPTVGVHEHVSVLFADICGFTQASSAIGPSELVDVLRRVFQDIDQLSICLRTEKIKTIGDCYMACGNLRLGSRPPLTAQQSAECERDGALSIMELGCSIIGLSGYHLGSVEVKFRVGVHTGPLVSGVIGLTKFSLDVWGDTVNIASRLETTGVKDRVHVSQETYDLVKSRYKFYPRSVQFKGRTKPVPTYLLDSSPIIGNPLQPLGLSFQSRDSGGSRENSVGKDELESSGRLSRASSLQSVGSASFGSPLVVGPSFFQKVDKASPGVRTSTGVVTPRTMATRVSSNKVKSDEEDCESLTEDLLLMMTPRSRQRDADVIAQSEVTQWLDDLGVRSLAEMFYYEGWRTLEQVACLGTEDFSVSGIVHYREALLRGVRGLNSATNSREGTL